MHANEEVVFMLAVFEKIYFQKSYKKHQPLYRPLRDHAYKTKTNFL
jgi:hypothetical protein